MSYELPDPPRDEDELVPSCSPAKSGPGQIAASCDDCGKPWGLCECEPRPAGKQAWIDKHMGAAHDLAVNAANRQESASIEQHREADALWRSIRFQPQDDAYLVVLSLVADRDRYRDALRELDEVLSTDFGDPYVDEYGWGYGAVAHIHASEALRIGGDDGKP